MLTYMKGKVVPTVFIKRKNCFERIKKKKPLKTMMTDIKENNFVLI